MLGIKPRALYMLSIPSLERTTWQLRVSVCTCVRVCVRALPSIENRLLKLILIPLHHGESFFTKSFLGH